MIVFLASQQINTTNTTNITRKTMLKTKKNIAFFCKSIVDHVCLTTPVNRSIKCKFALIKQNS